MEEAEIRHEHCRRVLSLHNRWPNQHNLLSYIRQHMVFSEPTTDSKFLTSALLIRSLHRILAIIRRHRWSKNSKRRASPTRVPHISQPYNRTGRYVIQHSKHFKPTPQVFQSNVSHSSLRYTRVHPYCRAGVVSHATAKVTEKEHICLALKPKIN